MLKKLLTVACATVAVVAASIAAPASANAYDTTACDQPSPPFEENIGAGSGLVFVGYELITEPTRGFTGVTLCFEVLSVGQSVHVSLHPTGGLTYRAAICGYPAEYSCLDVFRKTGVDLGTLVYDITAPTVGAGLVYTCIWLNGNNVNDCNQTFVGAAIGTGDLPTAGTGPCLVTQPVCVPEVRIIYGGHPDLTALVIVLGIPVPVDIASGCVDVPTIAC